MPSKETKAEPAVADMAALQAQIEALREQLDKTTRKVENDPWVDFPRTDDGYVVLPAATQHPDDHPEFKKDPQYRWTGLHWVKSATGPELKYDE